MKLFLSLSLIFSGILFLSAPTHAQQINQQVLIHARSVAVACVAQWRTAKCINALGKSNKDLVINYATDLNAKGQKPALETLKQGCAAATVEEKDNFPASAFASAYNECSNTIYELTTKTNILPDQSHYQLLVAGSLCMNADKSCGQFEEQMKAWLK